MEIVHQVVKFLKKMEVKHYLLVEIMRYGALEMKLMRY